MDDEHHDYSKKDKLIGCDWDECYEHYESGYYWNNDNHNRSIFISKRIVDKYSLDKVKPIKEWFDKQNWDNNERDAYKAYSYYLYASNSTGYSKDYIEPEAHIKRAKEETPHGNINSKEFTAWWNDFPIELLDEPEEDVKIIS